ncbi:MAG: hypothetical protein MUE85_03740 [Microscillaceae bacterium]|nr:hypothetical protein [Microscillaceae bacterium]
MNKTIAYILMTLGGLMMLGGFGSEQFLTVIWGAALGFGGFRLYQNAQKSLPGGNSRQGLPTTQQKFELTDEMIIRLAGRFGKGRLSVEDLVAQTSLNREQAQARLEKLHAQGICQIRLEEIGADGKIYYYF